MTQEILPADKTLRKKIFLLMATLILAGLLLIQYTHQYLEELKQISKENPDLAIQKLMFTLRWILGIGSILILITGAYLIRVAIRTIKSGRYPPPGMRVIKDTKIRTGTRAKLTAISLIVWSSILIILMHFVFFYFPNVLEKIAPERKGSSTFRAK